MARRTVQVITVVSLCVVAVFASAGILVVPEHGQVEEQVLVITASESRPEQVQEASPAANVPSSVHRDAVQGTIIRVIDGDTLVFDGDTYRLSMIDTPERGEDGFDEATDTVKALCPVGSTAYVEADSIQGQDRYGRYLGVVWCQGNGYSTTIGEYLSDRGLLKKFYTNYCGSTEAATAKWAEESGNWFYHSVCN